MFGNVLYWLNVVTGVNGFVEITCLRVDAIQIMEQFNYLGDDIEL